MKEIITIRVSKFLSDELAKKVAQMRWGTSAPQYVNCVRQAVFDELADGTLLKNRLVTVAGRREIIRCEANPFVINPFIHANIIESPQTGRGVSPLRVALILNSLASTILNKQIDALALMMNPPYLAPKGCFKGQQDVRPGKIIEYDSALMPTAPMPLSFDKAMVG